MPAVLVATITRWSVLGGDDKFAACLRHAAYVLDRQDRACADQCDIAERVCHGFDAFKRIWGIERHFDLGDARVDQDFGNWSCLGRCDAAQDRDQGEV